MPVAEAITMRTAGRPGGGPQREGGPQPRVVGGVVLGDESVGDGRSDRDLDTGAEGVHAAAWGPAKGRVVPPA